MWMINPKHLCKKHLLGEHGEMHKFLPSFRKKVKIDGRFSPIVQIQFQGYKERHDALAEEMLRRGMNHKSPLIDLPDFKSMYPQHYHRTVEVPHNIKDLSERCPDCRERMCTI